jgi:hypothetical protein
MNLHTACVVIPCYRTELAAFERIALERCLAVLGCHQAVLACPATLDAGVLLERHPALVLERFPADCFAGIAGYNRMLLSDDFYARFAGFEYILIHQLDAFVFRDELLDWCARGYDYIGAPWLPRNRAPGRLRLARAALRRRIYRLIDRRDRSGTGAHHAQYDYAVGNGGFCLRRVAAMRRVLRELRTRLQPYLQRAHHTYNEDIFFCVEANRYRRRLSIPDVGEGVRFAWESHPAAAAAMTGGELPFGCHGWNRLHRDDWRPVFARLGYDLDAVLDASGGPGVGP